MAAVEFEVKQIFSTPELDIKQNQMIFPIERFQFGAIMQMGFFRIRLELAHPDLK